MVASLDQSDVMAGADCHPAEEPRMTEIRTLVVVQAGTADRKPKQMTVRWDNLKASTAETTARLIVAVYGLIIA